MIFEAVIVIVAACYSAFIFSCLVFWKRIPDYTGRKLNENSMSVVVIVAARNESANISRLMAALQAQDYPAEKFRVMIVDDHSTDNTIEVVFDFIKKNNFQNCFCLSSIETSKKNAIAFAIKNSSEELIITTDADTTMGNQWISSIVHHFKQTSSRMICGPVFFGHGNNIFEKVQSLEFTGLTAMSAASITADRPMFCSGANLAFTREAFIAVKGYENSGSMSGDDTQLMNKIYEKFHGGILFLKDKRAIVTTFGHSDSAGFWNQRKRWASKIMGTLSFFTKVVAMVAWLFHFLLLIQIVRSVINEDFMLLFLLISVKAISEILLLSSTGKFFRQKTPVILMFLIQPLYASYIFLTGIVAPFSKFKWKGR